MVIAADKKTMDADHGIKAVKQGGIACPLTWESNVKQEGKIIKV